eukprot:gb/GFBE01069316.1/.p1 GENE.gb/GFBE01069316.1/~~gb/GFBE01069316.1/.p1  ORF type:complete len:284 (+),score=26.65 gb/GFBE01069316.1/:1-852(+)
MASASDASRGGHSGFSVSLDFRWPGMPGMPCGITLQTNRIEAAIHVAEALEQMFRRLSEHKDLCIWPTDMKHGDMKDVFKSIKACKDEAKMRLCSEGTADDWVHPAAGAVQKQIVQGQRLEPLPSRRSVTAPTSSVEASRAHEPWAVEVPDELRSSFKAPPVASHHLLEAFEDIECDELGTGSLSDTESESSSLADDSDGPQPATSPMRAAGRGRGPGRRGRGRSAGSGRGAPHRDAPPPAPRNLSDRTGASSLLTRSSWRRTRYAAQSADTTQATREDDEKG